MDSLRARLSKGDVLVGPFCLIPHPAAVEIMGRAGFDFLLIDGEHAQIGRGDAENLIRAAEVAGCPALMRFPGQDREWIAWVLDAGAAGVVVPRVETADQARAAVNAARFPPLGKRGFGLSRASVYGARLAAYRATANDELLLVVMVETADGVANIDDIASMPDIDAILIGVGDLSSSLGGDSTRVESAVEAIIRSCHRHGRQVGLAHANADGVLPAIARGVALHVIGGDLSLLQKGAAQSAQAVRDAKREEAKMFRVVKTDGRIPVAPEQLAQFANLDVEFVDRSCPTEASLIEACAGASALIVVQEPVSARVIATLNRCKIISRMGVGLDTVDVPAATAANIAVANVPDGNLEEVSTHAIAMMLACVRRLQQFDAHIRNGNWKMLADGNRIGATIRRTTDLTVGLVGFGGIGARVGRKAAALGFHICVFDPFVSDGALAEIGARRTDFETLLKDSDIVSLHAPLTKETRGLLNRQAIASMKPGAIVINTARGGMIDEAALADALASGHLSGAGIDTFEREPISGDHPLLNCPNILLSPHGASYSVQSMAEIRTKAFANVAAVLRGGRAPYQVNLM